MLDINLNKNNFYIILYINSYNNFYINFYTILYTNNSIIKFYSDLNVYENLNKIGFYTNFSKI